MEANPRVERARRQIEDAEDRLHALRASIERMDPAIHGIDHARALVETFQQTIRVMKGSLAMELRIADAPPDPLQHYIESVDNGE